MLVIEGAIVGPVLRCGPMFMADGRLLYRVTVDDGSRWGADWYLDATASEVYASSRQGWRPTGCWALVVEPD